MKLIYYFFKLHTTNQKSQGEAYILDTKIIYKVNNIRLKCRIPHFLQHALFATTGPHHNDDDENDQNRAHNDDHPKMKEY